jgi:ATP-dependent Clp endopeptidase proteolytic subunit ClpP
MIYTKFEKDCRIKACYTDLIDPPVIIKVNDFTEQTVSDFSIDLSNARNSGQDVIPIVIDSLGGIAHSAFAMGDLLSTVDKPVCTIVLGKAMSCGVYLAVRGSPGLRFIAPSACMMIHEVGLDNMGGPASMLVKESAEIKKLSDRMLMEIARSCKQKDDFFIDKLKENGNSDLYLTPKEACELGLVDKIKLPTFSVNVGLTMCME